MEAVEAVRMEAHPDSAVARRLAGSKVAQTLSAPWAVCRASQEAAVARSWAGPAVEGTTLIRTVATEAEPTAVITMGRS